MTPGARIAAAIEILDTIFSGLPAEQALTRWARASRFAGSKDRAALRDHVFAALRRRSEFARAGGGDPEKPTGRAVMLGAVRCLGLDQAQLFCGQGYAPEPASPSEVFQTPKSRAEQWNMPDWLVDRFALSLGEEAGFLAAQALTERAPVTLRVNTRKTSPGALAERLATDGIKTRANTRSSTALTVIENPRKLAQTDAYSDGLFDMQDAASQAAVEALPLTSGHSVLDFCAGGGGKSLAIAACHNGSVTAHDAFPGRMSDIAARAGRAGVAIREARSTAALDTGGYDLVLADAPCSGAGTWRRAPDTKWRLTPQGLQDLVETQRSVLKTAADFVRPGGYLAYATCSVLQDENDAQAKWFEAHRHGFTKLWQRNWPIDPEGDGFFLALFQAPA